MNELKWMGSKSEQCNAFWEIICASARAKTQIKKSKGQLLFCWSHQRCNNLVVMLVSSEEIERRDKLLTKFKKSRSHNDNENYKKSWNKVQRMIKDKKKKFVIGKLNDNIGKPKELWKSLKSLRLPSKANSSAMICLEKDGILSFDPETNAEIFKDFYSNLANNLVKKLPPPPQINMEKQQSIITTKN